MSFTLFPIAELCSVTTPELQNVHKMLGPIKCTSMVTRIAINLGCPKMANLAYTEGDVPDLGPDHFVHAHILCEESDHSLFMLYGRKVIRLPNPGLRLYSCKSLILQFDQMGEACHSFIGPPCTRGVSSHGGSIVDYDYTVGSPSGAPVGHWVWGWLLGLP
jgi:hypothetical protein